MKSVFIRLPILIAILSVISLAVFARKAEQKRNSASDKSPVLVRIGTAGISYPYNYPCDANTKSGPKETRVCGIEVDFFNRICSDMNLQCTWILHPLAGSPTSDPMRDPGGLLYDLLKPENGASADSDASYPYDVVISSIGASPARRLKMLFSLAYYEPRDVLIGNVVQPLIKKEDLDGEGFPHDKPYFSDSSRKLRIGTLPGDLYLHLTEAYPKTPKHIELIRTLNYDQDLVAGKIDLAMAWTGIEKKIRDVTNGGGNTQFGVVSILNSGVSDPLNGVVVASRISESGRKLNDLFNRGIMKSRSSGGNGGYHREIFMKALNADLWPCRRNPYVEGDPKCGNIPH
ncbi:MAG: substrate-binding periplasmic protein [Pseudobdellovibrionaceae bacterium]